MTVQPHDAPPPASLRSVLTTPIVEAPMSRRKHQARNAPRPVEKSLPESVAEALQELRAR